MKKRLSIAPPLDQFKIGTYQLGWRWVDLYADPKGIGGGCFSTFPDEHEHARITVGMDFDDEAHVFAVLCHEVWELAINEQMCSYTPRAFEQNASDIHVFFFDHNQHTEICSKAGFFIWKCIDDFKAAFKKCADNRKQLSQLSEQKIKKAKRKCKTKHK